MTEQEQIAQGSLQSSHRNTHAIILKRATQQQQEKAIDFLNSTRMDLVIQQRLLPEKAEVPLKRGTFFINTYTSKNEPGFIVFLENNPPIFMRYNLSKREREQTKGQPICNILRMRVSSVVNAGTVLVASIDTVNHKMSIEDVYIWANENIFIKKTFTERRKYMQNFVEKHWIPDVRLLGGIITDIIQPTPLTSFDSLLDKKDYMKVVFIPDSPGKRRFTFALNETQAKIGEGYYGRVDSASTARQNNNLVVKRPIIAPVVLVAPVVPVALTPHTMHTEAIAIRVPMLPDVYELYTSKYSDIPDIVLGRGCVQDLALSKKLNTLGSEIHVQIKYTNEFKRYEIIGLETP